MLIYIKLAIRNVHKRFRSVWLNGIGIALTVIAVVFIFSLSRGVMNQIVTRNIQFETGAITLTVKQELITYKNKQAGDEIYSGLLSVLDNTPEITGYRPRILASNAMLYAAGGNKRTRIEGLTPAELPLFLETVRLEEGSADWEEIRDGIVVSQGLAGETGLMVGDACTIVIQSAGGAINMQDYTVTGLFPDTSQANKYIIYTSYEQSKELYHANLPTHILVDIKDLGQAGRIKKQLREEIHHPWIEIEAYTDNLSTAQALSSINKYAMSGMAFFLLFISFVGIWAMQTENINERHKEIGTLLSFGFTRRAVRRIFLFESVYISLLFLLAGVGIALSVVYTIHVLDGLYLGSSASFAFGSSVIKPEVRLSDVFSAALIALFYPLAATGLSLAGINKMRIIRLLNKAY
ncbi:MAG: ABC transporter permease [Tannerellaceae bacterium]|jgi:ABC-type lipoprotein release transport system permease subunit|nr:ABC transporter permease [Tannerellaceae bacterium]